MIDLREYSTSQLPGLVTKRLSDILGDVAVPSLFKQALSPVGGRTYVPRLLVLCDGFDDIKVTGAWGAGVAVQRLVC